MRLSDIFEDVSGFKYHYNLNPKLFDGETLRPEVRKACLKLAKTFVKYLDTPMNIKDITFTGSNAAFNYTDFSDVDIHIINETPADQLEMADKFFRAKKHLWSETRNVTVRGYDAELYVEDVTNPVVSEGVYSLLKDEWVRKPVYNPPDIDGDLILTMVDQMKEKIDHLLKKPGLSADDISAFQDKLTTMRKAGVRADGDFSVDNIVFKTLRNDGYLDALSDAKTKIEDDRLTLESARP